MAVESKCFDITLMMHTPPEHIAHIINSSCLYSGLNSKGAIVNWITMNPRNLADNIYPFELLANIGLDNLIENNNLKVKNLARYINNEFQPQFDEIYSFLSTIKTKVLYLHYYPPFWEPMVLACKEKGIRVGLHVQNFDRESKDQPFFSDIKGAVNAIQKADFLTVSQQRDIAPTMSLARKAPHQINVLPKSVPPIPLQNAKLANKLNQDFIDIFSNDILTFLYLGRLEEFKNITWFLKHCLPSLENRKKEFQILIVGCGSAQKEINLLAGKYDNVHVFNNQVTYDESLQLVSLSDLFLFFSGFDYSPRIPLEAILLGIPIIIGRFEFNTRYFSYANMLVDMERKNTCTLEYSGQNVEYGIPNKEQTIAFLLGFLDSAKNSKPTIIPASLLLESSPSFGATKLLEAAFPSGIQ